PRRRTARSRRALLRVRRVRVGGRRRRVSVPSGANSPSGADPIGSAFIAELQRIAGPGAVLTEPLELLTYECDGLPHLRYAPPVVVLPSSAEQVQEVVRLCHRHDIPFVARGHGSG